MQYGYKIPYNKVLNEVSCLVNIGHFQSGKSLGNIQKVHPPQEQERDYSNYQPILVEIPIDWLGLHPT